MSGTGSPPLVRFILLALLLTACVFPPETRGESAAGCAALAALLCIATFRDRNTVSSGDPGLVLAASASVFAFFSFQARGASIEPLAAAFFAAAIGVIAGRRGSALRHGNGLPWALAIAGALVGAHAIYQWAHGLEVLASAVEGTLQVADRQLVLARLREGRAFGPFATPAALGGFEALAIPVTAALAIGARGGQRVVLAVLGALEVGALVASASATAGAALAVALVVGLARSGRLAPRFAAWAGAAFLLLVAAIVAMRGTKMIDPGNPDSPWRLRAGNASIAVAMLRDHPWVGVGPGGYGEAYSAYRRPGDNESRHVHCLPLELLAETGLVAGLCLSLVFYVLFLGPAWSGVVRGPPWTLGVSIGLAAFALQNLGDFTAFFPSLLLVAAILRGALAREEGIAARGAGIARTATPLTVIASGIVLAAAGLSWNARVEARRSLAETDLASAEGHSRDAVLMAPWNPDARLLRAEVLLSSRPVTPEELRTALAEAEASVQLSPIRAHARALRGRIRAALSDTPGAYADLREAARLYPMSPTYATERDALAAQVEGPR